jgi:hypothetical protein
MTALLSRTEAIAAPAPTTTTARLRPRESASRERDGKLQTKYASNVMPATDMPFTTMLPTSNNHGGQHGAGKLNAQHGPKHAKL